jgi:hypothetical protein
MPEDVVAALRAVVLEAEALNQVDEIVERDVSRARE